MADPKNLAPSTGDTNAPSFLNYSRGFDTTTSVSGQALSSFGETLAKGINLANQYNTEALNNEVRAAVETSDTRYIGTTKGGSTKLPEAAQQQIANLEKMKNAAAQGKISPEHYNSTLMVKAKEIRARYGDDAYADEIDRAFSNLLGHTPAQAMRKIVEHQAQQAQANAQQAVRHNRDLLDAMIKGGLTMDMGVMQRAAMPGAENDARFMAQARLAISRDQAYKQELAQKIQLRNLEHADGVKVSENTSKILNEHAVRSVQGIMAGAPEYKELQQLYARAREQKLSGRQVDPVIEDNIRVMTSAILSRGEMVKKELMTIAAGMPGVTAKVMEDAHKFVDDFVKSTASHITNKEYSLVGLNAATAKSLTDYTKAGMLSASEMLRKTDVMKDIAGPAAMPQILLNPETKAAWDDAVLKQISIAKTHDLLTNTATSLSEHFRHPNLTQEQAARTNTDILRNIGVIMTVPGGIPGREAALNLSTSLFSDEGKSFIARIGDESVRNDFILKMASPAAYANVKALADAGQPQLLRNYKNFIADGLTQMTRQAADEASQYNQEIRGTRIKFNESSGLFELQSRKDDYTSALDQSKGALRDAVLGGGPAIVKQLNDQMAAVNSYSKAVGETPAMVIAPHVEAIGLTTDPHNTFEERQKQMEKKAALADPVINLLLKSKEFSDAIKSQDVRKAAAAIGTLIAPPRP